MENGTQVRKKKKKTHRGYAFVVYEREKDMKGNDFHPLQSRDVDAKKGYLSVCISRFVMLTDTGAAFQ